MAELKTFSSQIGRLKQSKQNIFKALNIISLFSDSITSESRISDIALDLYPDNDTEKTDTEIKQYLADKMGITSDKIQYSEDDSISILNITGVDNNYYYNTLLEEIINLE